MRTTPSNLLTDLPLPQPRKGRKNPSPWREPWGQGPRGTRSPGGAIRDALSGLAVVLFHKTNPNTAGSVAPPGLMRLSNSLPMAHAMGFRSFGPPGLPRVSYRNEGRPLHASRPGPWTSSAKCIAWMLALLLPAMAFGADLGIVVDAGPHDRESTPIHFTAPAALSTHQSWELRATDGTTRPIQWFHGEAWFLESDLRAGTSRSYRIEPANNPSANQTNALASAWVGKNLELRFSGNPVLQYLAHAGQRPRNNIEPIYERGGYLHPVRTPSGRVVTDDYPANHIHHHGIWSAWTKTRFDGRTPDFWNMGQGKGRVDFSRFDGLHIGPVLAGFEARQVQIDTGVSPPVRVLEDSWCTAVYPVRLSKGPPLHVFDVQSEQRLLTEKPLELPKYYYGGLGFRGPWNWNGEANMAYLDSNGVTNRVTANGTRARWYWVGGTVDGALAGIAVLGHPANFRAPEPLRVHPKEPFVCWAPSHLGDWALEPGKAHVARYRFVVFDGAPDAGMLNRLWADFAEPPVVRVEPGTALKR